jgi:hypothetical protein
MYARLSAVHVRYRSIAVSRVSTISRILCILLNPIKYFRETRHFCSTYIVNYSSVHIPIGFKCIYCRVWRSPSDQVMENFY